MAILPNDIRFFYSGGPANQDPLASLGGQMSSTQIINEAQENVFNNVTLIEADNGMTDYRCIYVKNIGKEEWRNVIIWREQGTLSEHDSVNIGLGTSIIDGTEQQVVDRFTKPLNVNFSGPASAENGILIGTLAPGSHKSIWIQRVVEPVARTFKNNTFKLRVEVGNPAGGGSGGGLPPGTPPGLPPTSGGGGGGGGTVQCPTGQHAVNGVCIPDTVPPISGGGENIIWQSTSWSNGRDRQITSHNATDPDDATLSFGAGSNRLLQIRGASDPGFVLHSGDQARVYVDQFGTAANHYNASLEIQKFYPNSTLDNLSLRLRSRHNEGGSNSNRFGGYGMALHHTNVEAARENFHNDHTDLSPADITLPHTLQDGIEYGVRFSVRDTTDGKVEVKLELKGGAYGTTYIEVAKAYDNSPQSYMLDKPLYLTNRSYFWIRTNGPAEDVRYGFVVLRDLDKQSVTSCPQGYTLKNGICVANTLPGTNPPPSGGGGATIADYTMVTSGDFTCGSTATTIMSRMNSRNANVFIPLGDYTYTSSTTCWINLAAPLKPKILGICIGNHDDAEEESDALRDRYLQEYGQSLPYHSFTYRNTFVLVLYTYSPYGFGSTSPQYQFARQQLEAARNNPAIDWIIVVFHKPIYTATSNHSGYTAFRDLYHPLFDQYKVDLCLSGHIHNYQRTKPLKYTGSGTGNEIVSNEITNYISLVNPIFLIVGSGGREISSISSTPSFNAHQRAGFGYCLFSWSNNGKRLTGRFYDQTDTLRDEWTMDKTSVSTPPTNPPSNPPPPTTGGGGGQIDSNGIQWLLATGEQTVDPRTRNTAADKRWSTNYTNISDNGYECTAYFTFSGVSSSGHMAMKMWGPNHSGCTSSGRCGWYDIGIRYNGAVQLQYERPHPDNHDFSLPLDATNGPKYMDNIGASMDGNTIGLKWIIYPVTQGGTSNNGGIRIKFYADISGFVGGKPQNQWKKVVDFVDTGQVMGNLAISTEQDLEIRVSDTNSVTEYAGGKHVRRLSRQDINNGGITTPPPTNPPPPPNNPPPSGTSGNDAYGIKMIYPSKADGDKFLWDLTSNSRLATQGLSATRPQADGPWVITLSNVEKAGRMYIYTTGNGLSNLGQTQLSSTPPLQSFNHNTLAGIGHFYQARDWKNIEFTIYVGTITTFNMSNLTSVISLVARSVNHDITFGGCGGSSYHADFNYMTGGVRFKKEQYHASYAIDTFTPTNIGTSEGKYVGLKFVLWNKSDGNVGMEFWVDKDGSNQWFKYIEKTDSDNWGTGAGQCAGSPGGKKINWGSPVSVVKFNSPSSFVVSYLSIREISPPS